MKISLIFVLFTLSVVVNGWAAILQPIVLSLGAAFTALNLDVDFIHDIKPIIWKTKEKENKDKEDDK